jgi:hypothetical protein
MWFSPINIHCAKKGIVKIQCSFERKGIAGQQKRIASKGGELKRELTCRQP